MLIQFVLIAILLAAFGMTWKRARQRVISLREALAWSLLWITAGIGISHPSITTIVANFFGVGRGSDFVLYGSVILLFILDLKIFLANDKMNPALTDIVRNEALKEVPRSTQHVPEDCRASQNPCGYVSSHQHRDRTLEECGVSARAL